MAALHPFRALRPEPARAADVAEVPYDVVSTEEARALADGRPLSFIHVSRAEVDLPPDQDAYGDLVYETARRNYESLKANAPLVQESEPSLYVYRLRMGNHVQTGLAAGFSLDEYDRDVIRKHEKTRRDKEDDRTRHMVELRAQTGPVFLTHRASPDVDRRVAGVTAGDPLLDVAAPDGVRHTIWRVPAADVPGIVTAFGTIPALYIADGHHRAASAARARELLRASGQAPGSGADYDWFLGVAFPHDQVKVLPYNRAVKDLAGHTPDGLLAALRERFQIVENGTSTPARKGDVAVLLGGRWHTLTLGPARSPDPIDGLDVARLQDQILTPLLRIGDVRTDKRIDFVGGIRGAAELERLVANGGAAIAFAMHPVGVGDLMAVSDMGGIMPPKSTWFEPKLRDGLLIHAI
jgi:uncharacterized protein (DUF1015 family)